MNEDEFEWNPIDHTTGHGKAQLSDHTSGHGNSTQGF